VYIEHLPQNILIVVKPHLAYLEPTMAANQIQHILRFILISIEKTQYTCN
jgi:hypothetical protein